MSDDNRQTILLCDDDQLIITSLRGLFQLETDYELLEFTDPADAAREVERRPVDLVISDFLMPGMNGVEFLGKVKNVQPEAARILLTGFADKENAIRAINEVGLYQYLEKPWDNDSLLLVVRNALREKSLRALLAERIAEFEHLIALHHDLRDQHELVERELEMAARVQRSLLPDEALDIDGYGAAWMFRPCSLLGGDFYDVARVGNGFAMLVADVSGHGVQAALTSILLKASFQDAAPAADGPAGLLDAMNEQLYRFLPSGIYACAGLVYVRPGADKVVVANAGLPHPYVVRANGSLDELPVNGIPLGMFGEYAPSMRDEISVDLRVDDLLIFATDGLMEAGEGSGNTFADRELDRQLRSLVGARPQAAVDALSDAAVALSGGQALNDDLTILALRRESD